MLTVTTGLTGKVWQGLDGRGSATGCRALLFCGQHSRRNRRQTKLYASRLLREAAANGLQPSVAD